MKESSKYIAADKILRWSMTIAFVLLLIQVLLLGITFFSLPPIVPLYNQLPWGDDRIAPKAALFIPLVISFLFYGINYYLIGKWYLLMPLIARIISITTMLISILGIIFFIKTIQLLI